MAKDVYYGGNIRFIKTDNLRENSITQNFTHFLSNVGNNTRKNSQLKKDDIITTIIGATFEIIGRTSIVQEEILPANINQNIALIRADKTKINPHFLNIYLNTFYGRNMLHFHSRQTEQVNLNCREVEYILVPVFKQLELLISVEVKKIEQLKRESIYLYTQAENLLLEEIGLADFEPSQEPVNIKSFAESFGSSGRLDAEYYQPKYEQVMNKIISQNYDYLANLVTITKSIEPGSANYDEEGLPFMRVADFSKNGLTPPQKFLNNYYINENKDKIDRLKPKKGTILFSKDGSVGSAYQLTEDFNGITSGAVLHLTIKDETKIIPEYLTLALNSKLVQMQAERDAGGSIILHWRVSEIQNVIVPIIDYLKQEQIAELISQSFTLKKQSEHLLEVAKKSVEIAIEQDEQTALKYITKETHGKP